MASPSAYWHVNRRREILAKHPEIKLIPKHNVYALVTIFATSFTQLYFAIISQHLSPWVVAIFGWAIGGWLAKGMFSNAHEVVHRLISPKINKWQSGLLIKFATLPSFSLLSFLAFRWPHLYHHSSIASQSVSQARKFLENPDADTDVLNAYQFYQVIFDVGSAPRALFPTVFKHKALRFVYFVINPIIAQATGLFLAQPIVFIFCIKQILLTSDKGKRSLAWSYLSQLLLVWSILCFLYLTYGPLPLLYLFFAELAFRGLFFHPTGIYLFLFHKTFISDNKFQPTCSYYGRLASFLSFHMNYHVEHHDFVDIPRKYLPRLHEIAPEYYDSLNHYKGIFNCFKAYLTADSWLYGGVVDRLAPEQASDGSSNWRYEKSVSDS